MKIVYNSNDTYPIGCTWLLVNKNGEVENTDEHLDLLLQNYEKTTGKKYQLQLVEQTEENKVGYDFDFD